MNSRLTLYLICLLSALASARCLAEPTTDYWMGVYCRQTRIGYQHITVARDKLDGKDVYLRDDAIHLRGTSSGEAFVVDFEHKLFADTSYKPLREEMTGSDHKATAFSVQVVYGPKSIHVTTSYEGKTDEKTMPLDEDNAKIALIGSKYDLGALKLRAGEKVKLQHFAVRRIEIGQGLQAQSEPSDITVLARKKLELNGTTYDTLMVFEKSKTGEFTSWRLDNGEIVKQEIAADHVTWVRESKEKATEVDKGPAPDLDKLKK